MSQNLGKIWNGFTCGTDWMDEGGNKVCRGHRIHASMSNRLVKNSLAECIESCVGECYAIDYSDTSKTCIHYENTKFKPFSFSLHPLYSHQIDRTRDCFVDYNKEECLSIDGAISISDSNLPSGCLKKDKEVYWNEEIIQSLPLFEHVNSGMCQQTNLPYFTKTSGTICNTASLNKAQCREANRWMKQHDAETKRYNVTTDMHDNIPVFESLATASTNGVYNGQQKQTKNGNACKKWDERPDFIYLPNGESCDDAKGYESIPKQPSCSKKKDGTVAPDNACKIKGCFTQLNFTLNENDKCINQQKLDCLKNYSGAQTCQTSGQYAGTPATCKPNHKARSYPDWKYWNWNCSICEDGYAKIWNGECKPSNQAAGLNRYKGAATIQTSGAYAGSPQSCKPNHKPRSYPNWGYRNWNCSICEDGYTKITEDGSCRKIDDLENSIDLTETHFFADDFTWSKYFTKVKSEWHKPSHWEYDCSNCSTSKSTCDIAFDYLRANSPGPWHNKYLALSNNLASSNLDACIVNIYAEGSKPSWATGRFMVLEDVNHETTPELTLDSVTHSVCKKAPFADFVESQHDDLCRNPEKGSTIWCYTNIDIDNISTEECNMGLSDGEWKQNNIPHGCYLKRNQEVWYNHMYHPEGCNEDLKTKYCLTKANYEDETEFVAADGTTLFTKKQRFNNHTFTMHEKDASGSGPIEELQTSLGFCENKCRKNNECTSFTMIDDKTCRLNRFSDNLVAHSSIKTYVKDQEIYDTHENKDVNRTDEKTKMTCEEYQTTEELNTLVKSLCSDVAECEYYTTKSNTVCFYSSLFDDVHSTFVNFDTNDEFVGKTNTTYSCSDTRNFEDTKKLCKDDSNCIGITNKCKETGTCDDVRKCICPFDSEIKVKNTLTECRDLCKDSDTCNYFFHDTLLGCYLFDDTCTQTSKNEWGGRWEKKVMNDISNEMTPCGKEGADCLCKDAALFEVSDDHVAVIIG